MPDYDYQLVKMRDTYEYDRAGNSVKLREYVFFLGPVGPFTERVPLEPFDPNRIHQVVAALRSHLATQPV